MGRSDLHAAALDYADRGWPVFPLAPRDKHPLTPRGFYAASAEARRIDNWWTGTPDANIGLALGERLAVVDIDQPDHDDAREWIARFETAGVPYATTGKGRHYYFAGPARTRGLTFGDLKANGGYVLLPPSVHPSGAPYVWGREINGALTELPEGLPYSTGGGAGVMNAEIWPLGKRHARLKDLAVRLVRAGVHDADTIEVVLEAVYAKRAVPPGPEPRGGRQGIEGIAAWAAGSDIATRERAAAEADAAEAILFETADGVVL